jgi:putative ABC transport system substrate-binding protein
MRRRLLGGLAGAAALVAVGSVPTLAQVKGAKRVYAVTWRGRTQVEQGFTDYLGKTGLPLEFTWRDAAQSPARIAEFAREIRETKPDLVYTWGTPPTLGIAGPFDAVDPAKHVTGVPILFALVASPVGAKLVRSLKGQGRDVTGVYHVAAIASQVEAMRAYRRFAKVGVLYNAAELNSTATAAALKDLAKTQRFEVLEETFERGADGKPLPAGIDAKVAALKRAGAEWLYLGPDTYLFSQVEKIAAAAMDARLPTFSATEGVLASPAPILTGLVSSYYTIGQFAGFKAEQVLAKGIAARDIPIETLTRYSFIVRMEVAKALGALPPVSLFNHAVIR